MAKQKKQTQQDVAALKLVDIVKTYGDGENAVQALKGVNITFRKNEFVSVLGPSGCGKTTMLNIIGGLDRYSSGDLIINGVSTKEYKDKDWDTYRNNSIGFVFQSYNLIPHQTVLSNVELALTLSGVTKSERHARAKRVLEQVGLKGQAHKKPTCGYCPRPCQRPRNYSCRRAYGRIRYRNERADIRPFKGSRARPFGNYGNA